MLYGFELPVLYGAGVARMPQRRVKIARPHPEIRRDGGKDCPFAEKLFMNRELIINVTPTEISIALAEDKVLVELSKEQCQTGFSVGDIYLGKVRKIMPGLNAAFVNIGHEKDAFIHYLDLGPQFLSLKKLVAAQQPGKRGMRLEGMKLEPALEKTGKIGSYLEVGQTLMVQVAKEAISTKGPRLTADIAALQTKLDVAGERIETECAAVAGQYTETIAALQADIDSITAEVKAQYEAIELTAESKIDGTAIEAAITAMVNAAVAGQQAVVANNEAYTRLTADIAALQAKLDAAETQISDECADVADNYAETIEALQADIDSITAEVKAQYEALELTAESAIDGAAIEAAISEMIETAVAAQEAYEANEEAYARLTEDIAELQAKLDAAEEQIAEECPDVADRFTETLEALQADIDSISEEVEAQYEAIELTAENAIDGAEIEAAIEKAIEDAIEAQKEFSGIDSVLMDVENGKAKIYSISGQLLDAPVKGQVNIFKYTDGRVVKFYMK